MELNLYYVDTIQKNKFKAFSYKATQKKSINSSERMLNVTKVVHDL